MNKCKYCQVFIDDSFQICPLCNRGCGDKITNQHSKWYPSYDMAKINMPRSFSSKIALFMSITIIGICFLINLLTGIRNPWFLFVSCAILYVFLLIYNTLLSEMQVGAKILLQLISISSFLFILDYFLGFHRWSVNIVIPFLVITGTFLITMIMCIKKMSWNEYIGYVIAMIILGFVPILLYLIGVLSTIWASEVSAFYALLTTVGFLIFSKKKFKNELLRRFHF